MTGGPMLNGTAHTRQPPAVNELRTAGASLLRVVEFVILISAVPLQIALWRWAL
ncbi:hypothetical protein [Actinoallomurus sp. NPDC052274]|uniref:hypothetical protein n=1 Tax=Actinoallomurus sp. NPDC052274 TaxID=3155420 RepID=UPI00341EEC2C